MLKSHSNAGQFKFYFIKPRVESDMDEKECSQAWAVITILKFKKISKEIIVFVNAMNDSSVKNWAWF